MDYNLAIMVMMASSNNYQLWWLMIEKKVLDRDN